MRITDFDEFLLLPKVTMMTCLREIDSKDLVRALSGVEKRKRQNILSIIGEYIGENYLKLLDENLSESERPGIFSTTEISEAKKIF